jgi:hypothetical protein
VTEKANLGRRRFQLFQNFRHSAQHGLVEGQERKKAIANRPGLLQSVVLRSRPNHLNLPSLHCPPPPLSVTAAQCAILHPRTRQRGAFEDRDFQC